ncbi:MAG: anhydro-N-acetylmuramic acid kinase [Cereibacter sphaeroides]|uniref:Anhydro-N-acetylmuramic acid kinase n=1 Tax=Cereibacter sphaeroides TaxID=1063 RepID=A0A2W5SCV0_CERSP|nr:MAG: anhydro-N-acetylmuramic acid kinase [Cereibacter sphaeroides]
MLKSGAVWALGTMSGTSLDGVDAAMILTDGERILDFGETAYRPYDNDERATLRAALGLWPGDPAVEAASEVIETAHAELMAQFSGVQIAGFHGQTLAHDPGGRGTHQAGSGAILAEVLGLPVVWDFRSADVRMGGQGAPLAPYYHFACARWTGANLPVAFLNMGGVGNFTWVDPRQVSPELPGACLAFDTGPANAPVNDLMLARRGLAQDERGELAREGVPDETILSTFLDHPYFYRMPPKSLDRDTFRALVQAVGALGDADAAATLTAAAARAVARGTEHFPTAVKQVLVTGGGRHNATLMEMLATTLQSEVQPVEAVGLNGDMLEAQAFAYLAVRIARGLPTSGPSTTGVPGLIGGGQISRPGA